MVEYRDCPGFPGYRVGSDGSVWSRWIKGGNDRGKLGDKWILMRGTTTKEGYIRHRIRTAEWMGVMKFAHHLVLEAFVGPCPEGMQCRHLDGVPSDNRLTQICWGSPDEDHEDRRRLGTLPLGERHWKAKLTAADVESIRRSYKSGDTQTVIARRFGISRGYVSDIIRGVTWKHV